MARRSPDERDPESVYMYSHVDPLSSLAVYVTVMESALANEPVERRVTALTAARIALRFRQPYLLVLDDLGDAA
jgi:hypothetical protein